VATLSSILPNNKKIKLLDLGMIKSEAQFCSYMDLGLFPYDESHIELSNKNLVGVNILDTNIFKDTMIKVNSTPNRSSEISILGIAREISILNGYALPDVQLESIPVNTTKTIKVNMDLDCNNVKYIGRMISNVNVKIKTPLWIRNRLRCSNILSINVIIDIINYVLIEIGESIHVIDVKHINEGSLYIKESESNALITINNGKQVTLKQGTIVIADKSKILVIGNNNNVNNTVINEFTKNIFLGSLYLSPFSLKKDIRRINLNHKIVDYYQHSVNIRLQKKAINYVSRLILKICGGNAGPVIFKQTMKDASSLYPKIILEDKKLNNVIGYSISKQIVSETLISLGYDIIRKCNSWELVPPSWRTDIIIEEDVIADFMRIYGYANIKKCALKMSSSIVETNMMHNFLKRAKYLLIDKGYNEIITYGFVNPEVQRLIKPSVKSLSLVNPISKDMSVMRCSLWPGLLTTIVYNQNRQQEQLRFFESGLCFFNDIHSEFQINQELFLAGAISGFTHKRIWNLFRRKVDFYDLKGDVESILELYTGLEKVDFNPKMFPGLYAGQSAEICINNQCVGHIGMLHPVIAKKLSLKYKVLLFELSLKIFNNKEIKIVQNVSQFPSSRRDISIVLPVEITFKEILAECRTIFPDQISEISIFDVYSGSKLAKGKKSIAISFVFQPSNETLNEDRIDEMLKTCINQLKDCFTATLRN
ncbi:phenylalanine--tRNA ligase subunit beta, partial [Buchnera aphidicola (Hormaphis cornu)]